MYTPPCSQTAVDSLITLKAPAKINWSLYVLDKRPDGYHDILTLMHRIAIYDTITIGHSDRLELYSAMNIPDEQNIVFKAAEALRKYSGIGDGARIVLEKDIPTGAGLGGGSSDAAFTLIGLNRLWSLGLPLEELKTIGSSLGSDVPFFFDSPLAVAEGRGERLSSVEINIPCTILLIKPSVSVSTAWAYKNIDLQSLKLTKREHKDNNIKLIYSSLRTGETSLLRTALHNDFEKVVFGQYPLIGRLKEQLIDSGASAALMSGSGSSVFGFFEDRERAEKAAGLFSSHWYRVTETLY